MIGLGQLAGTMVSKAWTAISALLVLIITARYFGAEARGSISLLMLWVSLLALISQIVGGPVLVYFAIRIQKSRLLAFSYAWLGILLLAVYYCFEKFDYQEFIFTQWVIMLTASHGVALIHSHLLLGYGKVQLYNLLQLLQSLLLVAGLILAVALREAWFYRVEDATWAYAICAFSGYALVAIVAGFKVYWLEAALLKDELAKLQSWWSKGLQNQLTNVFHLLALRAGFFWLEHTEGKASLGLFSTALAMSEQSLLFAGSVGMLIYTGLSRNAPMPEQRLAFWIRLSGTLALIVMILLLLLPDAWYRLLLGAEFVSMLPLLHILAPGMMFQSTGVLLSHYYSGRGLFQLPLLMNGITMLLSIVLQMLLIYLHGLKGAAWATLLSYFFYGVGFAFIFQSMQKTLAFIPILRPSDGVLIKQALLELRQKIQSFF